ncbi:class I SAM-dependent methyltransferase [Albidovulum sediminicola]|uniref:Tetratricopeptide repeat protein n=1 Tax=Albidovulum sediminicola TaxID=2984331 RepID=A0ABT2Z1E2_9RHOB|nr:class I SAM-dependent methyltransferase [Defluviimonas sp. WL0075]MCV2864921.1 hypothetical protein [Defluviimonas sp. WL0075]
MFDELTRLAIVHGADKFGYHDYTPNYFKLFHGRREEPLKLLEIGVGGYGDDDRGGYSLRMWRDFFPNAEIVGIDIHAKNLDVGPRVTICQGSQVDEAFLRQLVLDHGPFDIIVDDGSHFNEHVVESYRILFPTLRPGGIYVAEDVQTAFRENRGGSLTLEAPNSIAYFADIQCSMGRATGSELSDEVVAVERFHNMIALHKASKDTPPPGVITSNRLGQVQGPDDGPARILFVGSEGAETGRAWTKAWSDLFRTSLEAFLDPKDIDQAIFFGDYDKFDLIVCNLPAFGFWDRTDVPDFFGLLETDGVLVCLTGAMEEARLAPSAPLMKMARQLFVEVDHLEMLANYPTAEVGPLAGDLQSIERYGDGFLFYKADNTYPSNFAFNFRHPRVRAAVDHIDAVLAEEWTEDGLLQAADMMRRTRQNERTQRYVAKIFEQGATRRMSFLLAADMAREAGDIERMNAIHRQGYEAFPGEFRFALRLAELETKGGNLDKAEEILRRAIARRPRVRQLHASLTGVLRRQKRWAEALEANARSIRLHPRPERPALTLLQAEMHQLLGNAAAARREVLRGIADVDTHAPSYRMLCSLEMTDGNHKAAADAIDRALQLDPNNAEYQALKASLAGTDRARAAAPQR